ncbi:glutamine amidotransferase-related protein [Algicola sagamiensis]|uniref:glutamine amidotransferase-related protein n=1 Tax=Algicola sagamiensis TaxID=163869 RepID=UPI00036D1C24|nr:hypothetical protein [Algicola sagamiensis]
MNIHFIIHEVFEGPGAYEHWAEQQGAQVTYSRVYQGDPLPSNSQVFDMLVILGGPQSPATTVAECAHFDSQAEQALIRDAINNDKFVIGMCLGAQLIGEALGAAHSQSPEKEIGSYPITLTEYGKAHPLFEDWPDNISIGHWHNDMPGLTKEAQIIATSAGCPRQIVAYSERVYGFQCHPEFTSDLIELLIENSEDELDKNLDYQYVQSPSQLRGNDYTAMNQALFRFLDKLIQPSN